MGGVTAETEALKKHEKRIRSLARKYACGDNQLFEDLVQVGFSELVEVLRGNSWRPDVASLLTYSSKSISMKMQRCAKKARQAGITLRSGSAFRSRRALKPTRKVNHVVSLDSTKSADADDRSMHETLASDSPTPEHEFATAERAAIVRKVLSTLPPRDAAIVSEVMAGNDYRAVAPKHGVTKSRVDQVVLKWLPVLRKRIEKELSHDDRA